MGFIDNIKNDIEEASARYDIMTDKIMLFESVAYNDYIIKQKEAYLDAYKYGGDVEDYFTESEGGSFADKAKATINKIIENLREFLKKCKEKVIDIFEKIRETSFIQKIENLIKVNPKVADIKVDIDDNSKKISLLEKELDSLNKQKARIKSGKISEKDTDEIEDRNNKVAVIIASAAAVVTITVGAILLNIKKTKDLNKRIESGNITDDEYKKIINEIYKKATKNSSEMSLDPETGHVVTSLCNTESRIKQAIVRLHVDSLSHLVDSARRTLSNIQNDFQMASISKKATKVELANKNYKKIINQNANDLGLGLDYSSTREELFDADEYFSELCNDIFGEDSSSSDDFDTMYSELCNDIFF